VTTISIPDAIRPIDLWVDFKTYAYCDTVAIRPLTMKGTEFVAGTGETKERLKHLSIDTLETIYNASTTDELRVLRRDFDDYIFDLILSLGYALNIKRPD